MIPATRDEALQQLEGFVPLAASHYSQERNFDRGPDRRSNVSLLSAALQKRLISEKEVLLAVARAHSLEASEKFVQEVLWRSYWKSWLELRPSVWSNYQSVLKASIGFESEVYEKALKAQTGIQCFDYWRKELHETGYLHYHSRMWFASIWIFTLKLPWEMGAKLFEEELCDFDPASNTLSWRWVAGLHTPGKHYLATAKNISTFTEGRFSPEGQLAENALSLPFSAPPLEPVQEKFVPFSTPPSPAGLLVHSEDFSLETLDWKSFRPSAIAVLSPSMIPFWGPRSLRVDAYQRKALQDVVERQKKAIASPVEVLTDGNLIAKIKDWAQRNSLQEIFLIKPWQGYLKDQWASVEKTLQAQSVKCRYLRRNYDKEFVGKAQSGFFSFKTELKPLWNRLKDRNEKESLWEVI
jgi:deoxyribodipyrimidine photo-lyase